MASSTPEPFRTARSGRRPRRPARAARAHALARRDPGLRAGSTAATSATCGGSSSTGATASTGARRRPKLNAFDQFRAEVGGIDLHFIHQQGVGPDPFPLVLAHGWPGSVWEFNDLIPRLTDPGSLRRRPGRRVHRRRALAARLHALVHARAAALRRRRRCRACSRADDGRARLPALRRPGRRLGRLRRRAARRRPPRRAAAGSTSTSCPCARRSRSRPSSPRRSASYQQELLHWQNEETGYHAIQGTKPQTLAYALTDSPAGLAAWIIEKFQTWSDHRGDFEGWVDRDALLTNIMLYWVTGAINSSFWPYYAIRHEPWPLPDEKIEVPTGFAEFPRRDPPPAALVRRGGLQHPALDGDAARRPLRRLRGAPTRSRATSPTSSVRSEGAEPVRG